ncbi:MAG: exodeoxyribonuclease V subunit alpha [Betaproteobacteria bacterium]|nr:exodeoxyribonuclease V subunit alpha [Betaproteobacteria bacterium]
MSGWNSRSSMLAQLTRWVEYGWLRSLDLALARFLAEELPNMSAPDLLLVALVSHQLGRGHVSLNLEMALDNPQRTLSIPPEEEIGTIVHDNTPAHILHQWTASEWQNHLDSCGEWLGNAALNSPLNTPLMRTGMHLYLTRYWRYEQQITLAIQQRLQSPGHIYASREHVRTLLNTLFPTSETGTDWQKVSCALALRCPFTIITGGPGTGKTTTVVRLLALLQSLALSETQYRPLRIRLATPTGKAAARLKESILIQINLLPNIIINNCDVREYIPNQVVTLHRLLGAQSDSRAFRYNARCPLPLDVLVVDEASMVDLEMMASLMQALPDSAVLILIGDKDQLASVEAGSILGDLCQRAETGHYTADTIRWIESMSGESIAPDFQDNQGYLLDQAIVMLKVSYRFTATSGIGQLAQTVNQGAAQALTSLWKQGYSDLTHYSIQSLDDPQLMTLLLGPANATSPQGLSGYLRLLEIPANNTPATLDEWALHILKVHGQFQLLCVLRQGPFGVEGLNVLIEKILTERGWIQTNGPWYVGRPVLVTRNDPGLGLMNGDIGITLPYPNPGNSTLTLRVAFRANDGETIRWILPARLPHVETVFALTVHKSQGSEFNHVALLLPPTPTTVLDRALLYTGITRAKSHFSLITITNKSIIESACQQIQMRSGGLSRIGKLTTPAWPAEPDT